MMLMDGRQNGIVEYIFPWLKFLDVTNSTALVVPLTTVVRNYSMGRFNN